MSAPATRSRAEILRYFFVLVVVLGLSSLLMTAWTYTVQRTERAERERLAEFHLRVAFLTGQAIEHVDTLRGASGMPRAVAVEGHESAASTRRDRVIATSVLALGQALQSVAALHDEWQTDADPFRASIERAERQYGRLRESALLQGAPGHGDIARRAEALRFTLFQVDRLHEIAAAEALETVARSGATRARRTVLAIVSVLFVSGLIIWRLLAMVRARLREQERTETVLRERERQLRHSSKMEALGTLVGGVAHDFNNILTAILGNVESLEAELGRADPRRGALQEIRKAGERAATLTRQLLAFSRQQAVDTRVLDANLLLDGLEPMLRRLIREDVSLTIRPDAAPCAIEVDPVQMEQVIMNLAVNARDAMPAGGELTVDTSVVRLAAAHPRNADIGPGEYVRIGVQDTGCGMSDEEVSRAFDPFYTTKAPGKGTGLGLSTVHGIVSRSGGHVVVRSTRGRGTRLDIYLPRSHRRAGATSPGEGSARVARGTETVLLAEDDPHVRRLAATALRRAGYTVLEAGDGQEALLLGSRFEGRLHLVVSDVVMPGLRGPEMAERLRERHPDADVLFISGYSEDETLDRGDGTRSACLAKPFRMDQLLAAVRARLDRSRGRVDHGERVEAGRAAGPA